MENNIKCPKCGAQIPLTEALTGQIEQVIKAKYETESAQKDKDYQAKLRVLQQQAKELEAKGRAIDEQVAEKLNTERKKIAEQEKGKILAEQAQQTKALEQELDDKKRQLSEAVRKELELRRERQKLEEEKQAMELTVQRKLDAERKEIEQKARQKALDEQALRNREKDDKIEAMTRQINDLQRKAEQGSQEAQGEALEGALQEALMQAFPFDVFSEVKKGQRGADILQTVRNPSGKECGKIVWEAKYTKAYANGWIGKLKSDQQEAKAEIAVLATMALPKEIKNFGVLDGVWITDYASAPGLASALRIGLINAMKERTLSANQDTMKDVIYRYVTGQEFAMQIRAVADALGHVKEELEREKIFWGFRRPCAAFNLEQWI
jgi:hypothetical protein